MNKYLIPAILGAVVLMAGIFAIAPVQTAQTVHTSINSEIDALNESLCEDLQGGGDTYDPDDNSCFID